MVLELIVNTTSVTTLRLDGLNAKRYSVYVELYSYNCTHAQYCKIVNICSAMLLY